MPAKNEKKHILIADDEEEIRKCLKRFLTMKGYRISMAENGREAMDIIEREKIDLVITDMEMPEMNGMELLASVKEFNGNLPVVMITGYSDAEKTVTALREGASDFINKPFRMQDINESISRLLELQSTDEENKKALQYLTFSTSLDMPAKTELVNGVIYNLASQLKSIELCDASHLSNMNIALYEALINAIEHGNKRDPDKKITLKLDINFEQAKFTIKDEGEGFDHGAIENPTDPENIFKMNGRGIYLMKHFMDEVIYNDIGNEVTMIKNRIVKLENLAKERGTA